MTFSDKAVAKLVNKQFVSCWKNLQPGYDWQAGLNTRFKNAAACRMISEGHSDKNIVTLFLTPELSVLHALPGYWYPKRFLEETRFVLKLKKKTLNKELELRRDRKPVFEELHREHGKAHQKPGKSKRGRSQLASMRKAMGHGRSEAELRALLAGFHTDRAANWGETSSAYEKNFRSKQIQDFLGGWK